MAQAEQTKAATEFAEYWADKGDEKQETARFWIELLQTVLGVENPAQYIEFEKRVQLKHTSFIDAYIPSAKVLIEQKGSKIDLHKAYEQSDGSVLTPYQQAKRYADEMPYSLRPAWIVVCNFREFLIYNMEKPHEEPVQILLKDLPKDAYLLNFLVQHKTDALQRELELSIEAGKIVGELYDELLKQYKKKDDFELKSLNMLCVRLVFCLYAEDSGIFGKRLMFHDFLASFNAENVRTALIDLFRVLDTPSEEERDHLHLPSGTETRDPYLDEKFAQFPYVNGGLFRDEKILIPPFNDRIRDFLLNKASSFDWSEISPTIFGAVFESTLNPETRRSGGMHYTSIENIHKVIDPLFMDSLNAEFEEITGISVVEPVETIRTGKTSVVSMNSTTALSKKQKERLLAFQKKLGSLTFLDPACGSGNFLTETYLSLRRLENRVISLLNSGEKVLGFDEFIQVKINQFYGIEINDFAVTVAKTALWIAESQMISETEQIVSQTIDFLPLTTNAFIVEGNALRMDWATLQDSDMLSETPLFKAETAHIYKVDDLDAPLEVRSPSAGEAKRFKDLSIVTKNVVYEVPKAKETPAPVEYDYIMGNPPFVGKSYQTQRQKQDMTLVFEGIKNYGNLDYVASWYKKAFDTVQNGKTRCAFVSTNSVCQGIAVPPLWEYARQKNISIDFAYRTFKWYSESFEMAHVHCVIVGFSLCGSQGGIEKRIFYPDGSSSVASNINAYLLDAPDVIVKDRPSPLADVPKMLVGSCPTDGGNLILQEDEKADLISRNREAEKYIKKYIGSDEFINGGTRYCLWLKDCPPDELYKMPSVIARLKRVKEFRLSSKKEMTRRRAETPTLFAEDRYVRATSIIIPMLSSVNRKYVPIGFVDEDTVVSNLASIIPNGTLLIFGTITSNVCMAWMRTVGSRLKSDYRFSASLVYNTFPWKPMTQKQAERIEQTAGQILNIRRNYPNSTMAQLYNDVSMPPDLRKAHQANDRAVMEAYGFAGTRGHSPLSEAEIVAELFKMYEKLCANLTNLLP